MACNRHPTPLLILTGCRHACFPRLRPPTAPSRGAVGVHQRTPTATFLSEASGDA
jgi:hypothetical protein